jgi:superfamily II DNA/RNA helicase
LRLLVATDAASEGLNLQRLETLINVDLPWNPARLEQRKGRIDRIGQLASSIDILNLRYRGSVEDEVHHVLSSRLQQIREIFGTIPDTLEDVWVAVATGEIEEAKRRIEEAPRATPSSSGTPQTCRNGMGALRASARSVRCTAATTKAVVMIWRRNHIYKAEFNAR